MLTRHDVSSRAAISPPADFQDFIHTTTIRLIRQAPCVSGSVNGITRSAAASNKRHARRRYYFLFAVTLTLLHFFFFQRMPCLRHAMMIVAYY